MTFDPLPILAALDEAGVDYVLGGDAAALIHGAPYGTLELEITPAPDGANVLRLERALERLESRAAGAPTGEQRFTTSWGGLVVAHPPDRKAFNDLKRDAARTIVNGNEIRVASLADVVRSKEASDRERDRGLLHVLRRLLEQVTRES